MDFHRSLNRAIGGGFLIAIGAVMTVVLIGGLTADTAVRINYVFFAAPVGVVAGVVMLINGLRPMTMRIDERGILIQHPARKVRVALGWQNVAGVSLSTLRKPKDERSTATYLTVWPRDGHNPGVPAAWVVQQNGWTGYRLVDVGDVRETEDQFGQALGRYAGPAYR
ncbi:hypothetical protein [Saccharopolyspora gregorii]|uniref:hypothetical protein n=1 Tax=Saccharopolyspora gregorii TaxID=33914 RepID=UPI0021ACD413|nr:hypothetical protein [Saccharopolyspora gregorii]